MGGIILITAVKTDTIEIIESQMRQAALWMQELTIIKQELIKKEERHLILVK
jgi:hypothetical protein